MSTVRTRTGAGLLALSVAQTLAAVAESSAAVNLTRQLLVAGQTAGDVLQVAGDVAALLMIPHAPLLCQVSTRRTLLFAVAVVKHRMFTLMSPGAGAFTLRRLRPTGDRRIEDRQPTVTGQLIKAGLPAGFTVATVTRLLAAVEATVQLVATDQWALVLRGHAAQLTTLVPATGAFLVTAPLTGENQLVFCENRCTWNLL